MGITNSIIAKSDKSSVITMCDIDSPFARNIFDHPNPHVNFAGKIHNVSVLQVMHYEKGKLFVELIIAKKEQN